MHATTESICDDINSGMGTLASEISEETLSTMGFKRPTESICGNINSCMSALRQERSEPTSTTLMGERLVQAETNAAE